MTDATIAALSSRRLIGLAISIRLLVDTSVQIFNPFLRVLWNSYSQRRPTKSWTLRQIDQDFPEQRRQPQSGDTYALRADTAQEPLITLVRHTCRRLLATFAEHDPAAHRAVLAELDQTAFFGAPEAVKEYRLDAQQRRNLNYTFARATCEACPLFARCVHSKTQVRTVRRQQTPEFKALYPLRSAIERKGAELMRHGLRHTRCRG